MKKVKSLHAALDEKMKRQIEAEIENAKEKITSLQNRLCNMDEYSSLTDDKKEQISSTFSNFIRKINDQNLIAVIRDKVRKFEDAEYPNLISYITDCERLIPESSEKVEGKSEEDEKMSTVINTGISKIEFVSAKNLLIPFKKAWLSNERDVDDYLNSMRKILITEIQNGKRVQI